MPGSDVVDREAARATLSALGGLAPLSRPCQPTSRIPTLQEALATEKQVAEALGKPVPVAFGDQSWNLDGSDLGPFVTVEVVTVDGAPSARLTVDTKGLSADLRERFSDDINSKPVDAVFGWDDGLVVVQEGTYGAALRSDAFANAVGESFLNGHGTVEIPVVDIAPEIDDTGMDAGIGELLGTGVRRRQQRCGATSTSRRADNHDGAPGGTFSFNGAIGEITADKGTRKRWSWWVMRSGAMSAGACTRFRRPHSGRHSWRHADWPLVSHTYRLPALRGGWLEPGLRRIDPPVWLEHNWADFTFENYSDDWLLVSRTPGPARGGQHLRHSDGATSRSAVHDWRNAWLNRTIYDASGDVIADRSFETYFKWRQPTEKTATPQGFPGGVAVWANSASPPTGNLTDDPSGGAVRRCT